jgi:hypothetical protein
MGLSWRIELLRHQVLTSTFSDSTAFTLDTPNYSAELAPQLHTSSKNLSINATVVREAKK